jgi:SecD/SecF fusion protein
LRLGLSFTGGTDVTVKFTKPADRDAVAKALVGLGVTDAQVNTLTKPGEPIGERYTIETQKDFGNNSGPLWTALGSVSSVDRAQSSISAVGPSLSHEYLLNAVEALVIAISIQFIYIAFRFGWNYIFGLVTIVALLRDSAMMIGIYSIANKRVDDAFLAAVLTVIGYSVNDSVVVFDRIRELLPQRRKSSFAETANIACLQTVPRTINTGIGAMFILAALAILGGSSLTDFALALLIGIGIGTYSSVFTAAPLAIELDRRYPDPHRKHAPATRQQAQLSRR